jgi:hypothetical protein
MQTGLQAVDFRVSDIRSVEEGKKVEYTKLDCQRRGELWGSKLTHGIKVRSSFQTSLRS